MALKDLVAQSSAMAEEAIEKIVKDYVRYDPEAGEIAFTPDFAVLGNKSKVLVYLVALHGWTFVTEDQIATPTKPGDIGQKLGIPGGTLRPLLKELKDRHLISATAAGYIVRSASFPAVERELEGGTGHSVSQPRRSRVASRKGRATEKRSARRNSDDDHATKSDKKKRRSTGIKDTFDRWVQDGFFAADGKTLADVQSRFHEEAIIIPKSSIPKYLLGAVRSNSLSRRKQNLSGKTVWVYKSK